MKESDKLYQDTIEIPPPPGDNNDRSIRHLAKKSYYILLICFVYLQIPES